MWPFKSKTSTKDVIDSFSRIRCFLCKNQLPTIRENYYKYHEDEIPFCSSNCRESYEILRKEKIWKFNSTDKYSITNILNLTEKAIFDICELRLSVTVIKEEVKRINSIIKEKDNKNEEITS